MKKITADMERVREAMRAVMREKGDLPLATWAVMADISEGGPRAFMKGDTQSISLQSLFALARAAGVSAARLLNESGMKMRASGYMLSAGAIKILDAADMDSMEEIDVPPDVDVLTKIVIVKGKDNYPEFDDGDLVVFKDEWAPPQTLLGKRAVIRLADGELLVGRLQVGTLVGRYIIQRINAPALMDAEVVGVAPIQWTKPAY